MNRVTYLIRRIQCRVLGHNLGDVVYISPSVLWCCRRCGRDIHGRTFADLEPMTEEDRDFLDRVDFD